MNYDAERPVATLGRKLFGSKPRDKYSLAEFPNATVLSLQNQKIKLKGMVIYYSRTFYCLSKVSCTYPYNPLVLAVDL